VVCRMLWCKVMPCKWNIAFDVGGVRALNIVYVVVAAVIGVSCTKVITVPVEEVQNYEKG
jgi:hypothetical protein